MLAELLSQNNIPYRERERDQDQTKPLKEVQRMSFELAAFADEVSGKLSEQIAFMRSHGIRLLEIRQVDSLNISDITHEKAKEIREMLDGNGISVWSIGSPFGKIDIEDDFTDHTEKFRHTLETTNILGAKRMRIFSFYHKNTPFSKTLSESVFERLDAFCNIANEYGVILCHENEKGVYGDTKERCAEILQELPSLRAVFDPANFIQCSEDTVKAWEMLEKYVEYLHIKDVNENGTIVPAGYGISNIRVLVEKYRSAGGRVMTLEPHLQICKDGAPDMFKYPDRYTAFETALNTLKSILCE